MTIKKHVLPQLIGDNLISNLFFLGPSDPLAVHNFSISTSSAAPVEPQDILHQYLGSSVGEMPVPLPEAAGEILTLLGLGLHKIKTVSANSNYPRPSLILNN